MSLSPAITTTMVDLGEADRLVGRTPWCRGIDDRPVVGTLEGVDAEILVALQPGVVLHQPPASGTDPVLVGLQERLGFRLGGGRLDGVRDLLVLLDQIEGLELAAPDRIRQRRLALEAIGACEIPEEAPGAVLLYSVDSIGVAGEDTYLGELDRAARGVATSLRERGVQPGDKVALLVPNVPEFTVAYFGILYAGATVVPINVLAAVPEVTYFLEDSGARVLVVRVRVLLR